jgi:adenine-specific DNA-methyltransferase
MNLQAFHKENLFDATHRLFAQLGIRLNSNTKQSLSIRDVLNTHYKENPIFHAVEETYFSGVIDHSIFKQNANNSYQDAIKKADQTYEGLLLFSLKLNRYPTRTEIAELVRAFNRISQKMPVALLLCYSNSHDHYISLGLPERFKYLQDWRQGEKIGKVIILRDIHTQHPHAGHLRTLNNLSIQGKNIQNFNDLHEHWLTILDLKILNKTFYNELANWFYWAMDKVEFPDDAEKNTEKRNAENLIRLITRFIFVWFMKEKKLVPQELFDKTYIDQLLNDKDKTHSTYYKAILQNLFFATLNTPMKKDDPKSRIFIDDAKKYGYKNDGYLQQGFYRYSRFIKDKEKFLKLFEQVPFLNGGLFDCLDTHDGKKEIRIDGFSDNPKNEERLKIPDELFFTKEELTVDLSKYLENGKNKTVTGLIPLLNKYIFTVAENTPIEEDVALDPELLGNVFENLLGAYLPESASTARKASGSYYTPKEIVNYMVDESLIYYFQTSLNRHDEDFLQNLRTLLSYDTDHNPFQTEPKLTKKFIDTIETIKVLDPACGSGAFPMAILNKLTHLLHKLDPENKVWKEKLLKKIPPEIREETEKSLENKSVDYIRKLGLIENCIYGVDIQTIAIQISKLRFFLSLLIEQTIDDAKPNRDIRALPNLETKFIAANTLLALNLNERGLAHTEEVEKLETELFKIREELFYANSRQKKLKLQEQEKKIREQLKQVLCTIGLSAETTDKIANWDPFDQHQSADWFDPEWMFGIKDGFNIVIGNPPYIQLQKNQGKLAKLYKEQGFQTFERTGDIYCLFYEKGIELLKDYGILCYITSNKWMRAGYGEKTRNFFCKHYPLQLIDLGSGIFESATVDTNILIIQKTPQKPQHYALKALDISKEKHLDSLDTFQNRWITLKNLSAESWTISNPIEQRIKEKIERIGKPLKDWDIQINYGIKTGFNEAFIIDGATKERLIAQDPKSAEIIKPLLRGRDIKRYKAEFADLWLINSHNGIREKGIPRIDVKKDYPAIYAHLKQYEPQLKKRQDKGDHWTNLRNCAYLEEFEKEKIIYIEIQTDNKEDGYDFPCFHYDDRKTVVLNTAYIMTGKEIKYILGVLNSTFGRHLVKNYVVRLSERQFRMLAIHVNQFPIPMLSESEQKPIVALVEKIIAGKASGEDTAALEREIDEMVYRLYGLSYEEVKVVDPEFWLSREEYEQVRLGGVGG